MDATGLPPEISEHSLCPLIVNKSAQQGALVSLPPDAATRQQQR